MSSAWEMAGIESVIAAASRYIIKRPRLTRLLDNAKAKVLMLIAPAGFGKTTLAREWVEERSHLWYRGTPATADVAALAAQLSALVSEMFPGAGTRMVHRMKAAGMPEKNVDILAELFVEDLADWPDDLWLVFDDYQFAMEAQAPERFIDLLIRKSPMKVLLTSRKRPTWATARRLLYGELYEIGRTELAMDHDEAASVLAHRKDTPAAGLVALAEGWPAVIGLAALTPERELPEGALPQALYDYLAEELYQAATPDVQRGLSKLALAPSLAEGIPEFLLGKQAPLVVKEGIRLGFLTPRSGTVDFHPLLRAFLATRVVELPAATDDADRLARHLASTGRWDDAFSVLEKSFDGKLLIDLLEGGLTSLIDEARISTLRLWLDLARQNRLDAPIVDLAEAEIAYQEGQRRRAESLALRAAKWLGAGHPLLARAYHVAGMSAHLDCFNERAHRYFNLALDHAEKPADRREAVWGQLVTALNLGIGDVAELAMTLHGLDDGSALSEARLLVTEFQVALRSGDISGCEEKFQSAGNVIDRVTDPYARSSFHSSYAALLTLRARYTEGLREAQRTESYAKHMQLLFVIPHAKRIRAVAELGLRHLARTRQIIDWLEEATASSDDVFNALEARLIRARLLLVEGLADRAAEALRTPPSRFPFESERGEYLATLGLAQACTGERRQARRLLDEAEAISTAVETKVLVPSGRAILQLASGARTADAAVEEAFRSACESGNLDSFVISYRAYPRLLEVLAKMPHLHAKIATLLVASRDTQIAKRVGLTLDAALPQKRDLSPREHEVLRLIAEGLPNREIAKALFISESTAKLHVHHIFEKLGVRTRTEAALRLVHLSEEGGSPDSSGGN